MSKELTVNIEWLKFIATKITDGSITITQAANNAYIDTPKVDLRIGEKILPRGKNFGEM